jgi:hypothetical protein
VSGRGRLSLEDARVRDEAPQHCSKPGDGAQVEVSQVELLDATSFAGMYNPAVMSCSPSASKPAVIAKCGPCPSGDTLSSRLMAWVGLAIEP